MSVEIIKKNILRILEERDLKLSELEKKAGTNRNIYEILRGRNIKPSAHIIKQIANALSIGYHELLDEPSQKDYIQDYILFSEASILLIEELKQLYTQIKISYSAFSALVQEICSYSIETGNKNIDKQFVKWSVMKYYSANTTLEKNE